MKLDRAVILRVSAAVSAATAVTFVVFVLGSALRSSRPPAVDASQPAETAPAVARHAPRAADRMLAAPAAAMPAASALTKSPETLGAQLRQLVDAWTQAETDNDRAALIEAFTSGLNATFVHDALDRLSVPEEMLGPLERAFFARLTELDPAAAVARLGTLPSGQRRDTVRLAIALQWAETDLPAAIVWVAQWPEAGAQTTAADKLRARFTATKEDEMEDLGAIVAALPRGQMKTDLLDGLLQHWGGADFACALAWAQALATPVDQERALLHLSYRWEKSARDEALTFAQTLPEGRDALVVTLAAQWAQTEPQAATKWATSLPDGPRREKALSSLLAVWAQQDPQAARDFLLQLPPSPARNDAAISVLAAWAAQEPALAAQWAEGFPAGQKRDYAIENVAYRWMQNDPVAAVGWLQRLPTGRERDVALHAGAGSLVDVYPDLAAQLAVGIGDEAMRHQQTERAARAWLAIDPEAARAWIEQSNLPSAIKRQLSTPRS